MTNSERNEMESEGTNKQMTNIEASITRRKEEVKKKTKKKKKKT